MNLTKRLLHQLNTMKLQQHDIDRFISYFKTVSRPIVNGLVLKEPDQGEKEFGATNSFLDLPVLYPNGDGSADLPVFEPQSKGSLDTMACVTHGSQNHIETVIFKKFGVRLNFSERFTAKMSNTSRNGNTITNVLNCIRKDGMVFEEVWPFANGMNWDSYYSPISSNIIQTGLKWGFVIKHWPVNMRSEQEVWEAHRRLGTIIMAVDAWYMKNGLFISPAPGRYTHVCLKEKFWPKGYEGIAFDSYDNPYHKPLHPNFDIYPWGYICDVNKLIGTTDGEKLYNLLLGKEILLVEKAENHVPGEAYRLYPEYWDKTQIIISDKKLFDVANQAWRANKSFVGVNAKVFLELKHYYEEKFGSLKVEEAKVLFTGTELLLDPKVV